MKRYQLVCVASNNGTMADDSTCHGEMTIRCQPVVQQV